MSFRISIVNKSNKPPFYSLCLFVWPPSFRNLAEGHFGIISFHPSALGNLGFQLLHESLGENPQTLVVVLGIGIQPYMILENGMCFLVQVKGRRIDRNVCMIVPGCRGEYVYGGNLTEVLCMRVCGGFSSLSIKPASIPPRLLITRQWCSVPRS